MDNYAIADRFDLLAKLMDIHGENSFKAKSYATAAFTIEKLPEPLANVPAANLASVKGIGDSTAKKVLELLTTGELNVLQEMLQKTPAGVLEMLNIKGLGPKKINTVWKKLKIDNLEELEAACREGRVATTKGFGAKTALKILESIEYLRSNRGRFLYKQVEDFALALQEKLTAKFHDAQTELTGEFRRQLETVGQLEWVTTASKSEVKNYLSSDQVALTYEGDDLLSFRAEDLLSLQVHLTSPDQFGNTLVETSSSEEFISHFREKTTDKAAKTEAELFAAAGLPLIPAYLRESAQLLDRISAINLDDLIQPSRIKGLIHSHSTWSDGAYDLSDMADELVRLGFEYLVISDHSKSAFYANGLSEDRIRAQHRQIDELNGKLAPFKIFKSIECDILGDGTLDYTNDVLSSFDLVITSIHSNLDMDEEKAMERLLGAIANPYTTILGHMTGRLLLKRRGYPVDHKAIIDACVRHNVVIEINASPSRLDMDWRWIDYALEQGMLLSINPDAHSLEEFRYVKYGTLVAQKGGLPATSNLSSFSLSQFEEFLSRQRQKRQALK